MSDSNPRKPRKEGGYGRAGIAGEKSEEVKSNTDPVRIMDVATGSNKN
jgi:hypothetical protein